MKKRKGYISNNNSSSSSFLIMDSPQLNTLEDVEEYLGVEVTTENEKDLTKFKEDFNTAKKITGKKAFVSYFISSLYSDKIPFSNLIFDNNDAFWDDYSNYVSSFINDELVNEKNIKEFNELYDLLMTDIIINFMFYMFTKLPKMIAHIDLFEAQHEDYNAKCEMENSMYLAIANCIYNKLKNANLLENVREIKYEDVTHSKLTRGEYFDYINIIERF
jgi:hypothetical protein